MGKGRKILEDSQTSVLCSWREVVEAEVKAVGLSAVDLPLSAEAKGGPERDLPRPFFTNL